MIVAQLDTDVKTLDDDRTFQPRSHGHARRGGQLTDEQRAGWATTRGSRPRPGLGTGLHVRRKTGLMTGPPPRQGSRQWLMTLLERILALTEDDTGKPEVCMYDEDGPPSTSQARVGKRLSETIWAVRPPVVEEQARALKQPVRTRRARAV